MVELEFCLINYWLDWLQAVEEDAVWGSTGKVRLPLTRGNNYDITVCRIQADGKRQPCEKVIHSV